MTRPAVIADLSPAGIVADSLSHLVSLVQADGRFVYAHPAGRPDAPLGGYNMLRHCGTVWFMLRAVNDLGLDPGEAGRKALERAVRYAGGKMKRPDWIAAPSLAFVTKDAVKTGGIGLALVMLAEYRKGIGAGLSPDVMPIDETIAGLQTYAIAQIQGEDFLHKRSFADGTVLPFRSDYYTGEVLLGLFVTGCTDPSVIAVAEALMARGYGFAEQSHWMAYAACEAASRGLGDSALVHTYISELMSLIVVNDSYRARRNSTPIACRTEALTRFLMLADQRPGTCDAALVTESLATVRENLALQMRWYAAGQFWKGDEDDKVQIDYIQHNATSFLNLCLYTES
jgi:hypothetical protein